MQAQEYHSITQYIQTGAIPDILPSNASNFKKKARSFTMQRNALYKKGLPVVKWGERRRIFDTFHQHHESSIHITTLNTRLSLYQGG